MHAELVRAARERLGLTQRAFANVLGMGKHGANTISRWESGRGTPGRRTLAAIRALSALASPAYRLRGQAKKTDKPRTRKNPLLDDDGNPF